MRSESILSINHSSVCKGAADPRPRTFTDPTIVIDFRERLPYDIAGAVTEHLKTGDYAPRGYEDRAAAERKTQADAYRSLGYARERFRREFERLGALDYGVVIVECSMPEFMIPPPFSDLHPKAAIGTLMSWSVRYRVPVIFAGNREHSQWVTQYLLSRYVWYAERGNANVR